MLGFDRYSTVKPAFSILNVKTIQVIAQILPRAKTESAQLPPVHPNQRYCDNHLQKLGKDHKQ